MDMGKSFGETARLWARWVAVLPAAVLSVLLVSFPIHWAVLAITTGANDDGVLGITDLQPETLERLVIAFFGPMAYVVVGAKVAPKHRLRTAVVLIVLLAIVLSASTTYVATSDRFDYDYEGGGWAEFVAVVGLWIGGVLAGIYYINENPSLDARGRDIRGSVKRIGPSLAIALICVVGLAGSALYIGIAGEDQAEPGWAYWKEDLARRQLEVDELFLNGSMTKKEWVEAYSGLQLERWVRAKDMYGSGESGVVDRYFAKLEELSERSPGGVITLEAWDELEAWIAALPPEDQKRLDDDLGVGGT
ncbi:MAG TPA: hypothetical protein VNL92_00585, partial [Dehalococcoidia bacterium]|nr:hypothetical protein [Dehalococcoidia bacterium]